MWLVHERSFALMLHVKNDRQDMLVVSLNGKFKFNLKLVIIIIIIIIIISFISTDKTNQQSNRLAGMN